MGIVYGFMFQRAIVKGAQFHIVSYINQYTKMNYMYSNNNKQTYKGSPIQELIIDYIVVS